MGTRGKGMKRKSRVAIGTNTHEHGGPQKGLTCVSVPAYLFVFVSPGDTCIYYICSAAR